jgi:multidrug efflux pump subunit AcrA (membrane-fusion protein)
MHINTPAEITFDPYPGIIFDGKISLIGNQANPGDGLYEVEISLSQQKGVDLKPGLIGHVKLNQTSSESYSIVPLASLLNLKGMEGVLYLVSSDRKYAVEKPVSVKSIFADQAALEDDLGPYEYVIVHGNQNLVDGNPITVVE